MNLKFGTGGLRATMGPGPDHLNLETIQEATLGVADYAMEQSEKPSAALAYDSRNHSEEFAREAARVLAEICPFSGKTEKRGLQKIESEAAIR